MRSLTYCVFLFILVAAMPSAANAETRFDAAARAKVIAPFVEEETALVFHVDISRVAVEPLCDIVGRINPPTYGEFDGTKKNKRELTKQQDAWLQAGLQDIYGVVTLKGEASSPQAHLVIPLPPGMDEKTLRSGLPILGDTGQMVGRMFVSAPIGLPGCRPEKAWEFQPVERPELTSAFEAAGDTAAQVILTPPAYTRRVIEELLPEFPDEVGGGPTSVLIRSVAWGVAGFDLPPHPSLRLVVQSPDTRAAEAFHAKLLDMLRSAGQRKEVRAMVPKFDKLTVLLSPRADGDRLVFSSDARELEEITAMLASPIESLGKGARMVESANNLTQIGQAMLNYEKTNKHLPLPASRSADGKPLLSWRVHLLPYVGQDSLFRQFHLDEPWDSPHNRTLIDQMPTAYRLPISKSEKGRTNYLLPVGGGAVFSVDSPTELKDITDGASNTIMVVGVDDDHAVIWTKPDDLSYDPQDPRKGLGRFFDGGFHVTLCDGSIRLAMPAVDTKALQALFSRAGGEVVDGW